jgi:hypothetical protein
MEKRFAEVTIDGVAIQDAGGTFGKCTIVGAESLFIGRVVTGFESADGDFHQQVFPSTNGSGFEIKIIAPAIPIAKFTALVAAVRTRTLALQKFVVSAVDDWQTINHYCRIKDERSWLKIGRSDGMTNEDFVEGVELTFVTQGPA